MSPGARPHLRALTSVRFIAAALVVMGHARGRVGVPHDWGEPFSVFSGVPFFFVLSGFILAYVYPDLSGPGTRQFLVARFARLWPVHAVMWCVVTLAIATGHWYANAGNTPTVALANLAMVHSWVPTVRSYFSFNEPSWSISTEFFFYLLFPLILRTWKRAWSLWLIGSLVLCTFMGHIADGSLSTRWIGPGGIDRAGFGVNPLACLYLFILGVAAHRVWTWLSPRLHVGIVLGTLIEVAALGMTAALLFDSTPLSLYVASIVRANPAMLYLWMPTMAVAILLFPVLIVVLALERGLITRALAWGPCVLLGEMSYALYLVHLPILTVLTVSEASLPVVPDLMAFTAFWLFALGSSWVLWRWVEQPARRYIRDAWGAHEFTWSVGQWRVAGVGLATVLLMILAVHIASLFLSL